MKYKPLGDYREFRQWSGRPRFWGPSDGGWQAWFGGGVVDGLCDVLDRHLSAEEGRQRYLGQPAAIGCVPWLTSSAVIERLRMLSACCVVVDKGSRVPAALVDHDRPFPNVLPSLRLTMPAVDGAATVLGPYGPSPEHELGPVREVGWREIGGRMKPLLHAKMLVLGHLRIEEFGPDGGPTSEKLVFHPRSVWWGSANWTEGSTAHIEFGCWGDDADLTDSATEFMEDIIRFSEPFGTSTVGPEPNLLDVEFDDDAMREALESQEPDEDWE